MTRISSKAPGLEQGVEFAADQGIAAGAGLEFDQAVDRLLGVGAARGVVGGAVVAFDHGEGAARFEDRPQVLQDGERVRQVFEHETDEDVVEGVRGEGQVEDIGLAEGHVGQVAGGGAGGFQGCQGDVDGGDVGGGAVGGQDYGLGADAAAGLEDAAAGGVVRVMVEEVGEGVGLVEQACLFAGGVAVDVAVGHGR